MFKPFKLLWQYKRVLIDITMHDVKAKYAASVFGMLWIILFPLLLLLTYAVTYILVLKIRIGVLNPYEYTLLIFCGLVPFLGFSGALSTGTGSVAGNAALVKNTIFPIELIPAVSVLSNTVLQLVGMCLLALALMFSAKIGMAILLVPIVLMLQVLFTVGIVWILSSLNVYFRDLTQIISIILIMLMVVSPIAYTEDMIPAGLRIVMLFNPLYYLILLYRNIMMFNTLPPLNITVTFVCLSFFFFIFGYWFFSKIKKEIIDYV